MPKVINRLSIVCNESLQSYLSRLGVANHYRDKIRWYADVLGPVLEKDASYIRNLDYLDRIAEMASLEPKTVRDMLIHRYTKCFLNIRTQPHENVHGNEHTTFGANQIGFWFSSVQTSPKFCLKCWADNGAVLLPWLVRLVTTCPTHHTCLLDRCPTCNGKLSIYLNKCHECGRLISSMETFSTVNDPVAQVLTELVWHQLGYQEESRPVYAPNSDTPFFQMSAHSQFTYLREMGRFLQCFDYRNRATTSFSAPDTEIKRRHILRTDCMQRHQLLRNSVEILMQWPNTWLDVLDRLAYHYSKPARSGIVGITNPLDTLSRWMDDVKWRWFWQVTADYMQNSTSQRYIMRSWVSRVHKLGFAELDISAFKSSSDDLSRISSSTNQNPQQQNPTWEKYISGYDYHAAARFLGVRNAWLAALIHSDHIKSITPELAYWSPCQRFDRKELLIQLQALIGNVPMRTPPKGSLGRLTLARVLSICMDDGIDIGDIIAAVLSGQLVCYRKTNDLKLIELWFDKATLTRFRHDWLCPQSNELLTVRRTMAILNVSLATLKELRRDGHLLPVIGNSLGIEKYWRYRAKDLQEFEVAHVWADEVAEIIGITPNELRFYIKTGKMCSFGYQSLADYRRPLARIAVVRWRYERLNYQETVSYFRNSPSTLEMLIEHGELVPLRDMPKCPPWFDRKQVQYLCRTSHSTPSLEKGA